jgi:hypothetical protein
MPGDWACWKSRPSFLRVSGPKGDGE